MKTPLILAASFLATLSLAGAADAPAKETKIQKAIAVLQPTHGNTVQGKITFSKAADGVHVEGEVTGLTPGKHGFHIHQFGDASSPDGKAAGDHFNPEGHPHGAPDAEQRHAGDFGNIEADASGAAKISFVDKHITFEGTNSIIGRGVVVHAKADDLKTQPSGDAGPRVAVGAIGIAKGE